MTIENGVFSIDAVQRNNINLTLHPDEGVLYSATLQIAGSHTILLDGSLLVETGGRMQPKPSYYPTN